MALFAESQRRRAQRQVKEVEVMQAAELKRLYDRDDIIIEWELRDVHNIF